MKKFVEKLQRINRENVRGAILAGAGTGTAIGTTVVSVGLVYCFLVLVEYGTVIDSEWLIRAGLMILHVVLGIYYASAYYRHDNSSCGMVRCRRLLTGDSETDKVLCRCILMFRVVFAMTGIVFTAFFVFWPVLLAKPLLLVLWAIVAVPMAVLFRIGQNEINALYISEALADHAFALGNLDEEGDVVS